LDAAGIPHTSRNYAREPLTDDELDELIGSRPPREAINARSPAFRALKMDITSLDEAQARKLMAENQNIIRRPVLAAGHTRIVGFDPDIYATLGKT
jgi:arsenate reductase-like glutaredoxin family protein